MVRGAGSSPGPGIADRSVRGEGETAEQDHVASGRVVSRRRFISGGRAGRGRLFGPGRTVPDPGIAEVLYPGQGVETAEQDHVARGRVISHRRAPAGRWAGRGGLFGPGRTVPDPGTAERDVGVVAAEHDDVAGGRVVGHCRAEPGRWAGRGCLFGPG